MTVVCSAEVKERLISLLERIGLPSKFEGDTEGALNLIVHDKKNDKSKLSCIFVDKIGSYRIEKMSPTDFCDLVRKELQ
jgi:3-dehydroquinate synthetase